MWIVDVPILKRISSKEPYYNHLAWEDEWRTNQGYMANIARYAQDWGYKKNAARSTIGGRIEEEEEDEV